MRVFILGFLRVVIAALCVGLAPPAFSQSILPHPNVFEPFRAAGLKLYSPTSLFSSVDATVIKETFEEMKDLNPRNWDELQRWAWGLEELGIVVGIGSSSAREGGFGLYEGIISYANGRPIVPFGFSPEATGGALGLLTHDGTHSFLLWPRIEQADIDRLGYEGALRLFADIYLDKEVVASSWTALDYYPRYWNWRNQKTGAFPQKEFEENNFGLFSIGTGERADVVEGLGHLIQGRTFPYIRNLYSSIHMDRLGQAIDAGVPMIFPRMDRYLGKFGERLAVKTLVPLVEGTIGTLFRKGFGHKGQIAYSLDMARFYAQPWVVEWAKRFDWGVSMPKLRQHIDEQLVRIKEGRLYADVSKPPPFRFEMRFLKNQTALFARRVLELKELVRRNNSNGWWTKESEIESERIYEEAGRLADDLTLATDLPVNAFTVQIFIDRISDLMEQAEKHFPLAKKLPVALRPSHVELTHYWRDPNAYLLPRSELFLGSIPPQEVRDRKIEILQADRAGKRDELWAHQLNPALTNQTLPEFNRALGERYLQQTLTRDSKNLFFRSPGDIPYVEKLEEFKRITMVQLNNVVLPQVVEANHLSTESKSAIVHVIREAQEGLMSLTHELANLYQRGYLDRPLDRAASQKFAELEFLYVRCIDWILYEAFHLLNEIEQKKHFGKLKKRLDVISGLARHMNERDQNVSEPNLRRLSLPLPIRGTGFIKNLITYLKEGVFLRRPVTEMVQSLRLHAFSHHKKHVFTASFESLPDDPDDAVYVLGVAHDYSLFDTLAHREVANALHVEENFLITNQYVWPHYKLGGDKNDPTAIFPDKEQKPLDVAFDRVVNSRSKRTALWVGPEGLVPQWYAQAPLAAKWGAFILARRLAVALKGKKKVYYIPIASSAIPYMTQGGKMPFEIFTGKAELVPTEPLTKDDPWAYRTRLKFEAFANQQRGVTQVDLIRRKIVDGSTIPYANVVSSYVPVGEWLSRHFGPLNCTTPLALLSRAGTVNRIE